MKFGNKIDNLNEMILREVLKAPSLTTSKLISILEHEFNSRDVRFLLCNELSVDWSLRKQELVNLEQRSIAILEQQKHSYLFNQEQLSAFEEYRLHRLSKNKEEKEPQAESDEFLAILKGLEKRAPTPIGNRSRPSALNGYP